MTKTVELDLKVTFTQSVEVEVDDEMLQLVEDYWLQNVKILECHDDPNDKKIADFLNEQIDFDGAGNINAQIELFNEI